MNSFSFVNCAGPMERRDPDDNSPKMCTCVAPTGSSGISRLYLWVDCMMVLFGSKSRMCYEMNRYP